MPMKPGTNKYKTYLLTLNRSFYNGMGKGTFLYTPVTTPSKGDTCMSKHLTQCLVPNRCWGNGRWSYTASSNYKFTVLAQLLKSMQQGTKMDTEFVDWSNWVLQKCRGTQKIATHSLASCVCSFEVWRMNNLARVPTYAHTKMHLFTSNLRCNTVISQSWPHSSMEVVSKTSALDKSPFCLENRESQVMSKTCFLNSYYVPGSGLGTRNIKMR